MAPHAGQRPNLRVPLPLDPSPHPPPCRVPRVQRRQRHTLAFTNAHLPRFVPRPKLSFIALVDFGQTGGRVTVRRSKTDQDGEGAVQYLGKAAAADLRKIRPVPGRTLARRTAAAAKAAGLEGAFSGHSGRVGMARDLVAAGASVAAVQVAGRWESARMPARYAPRRTRQPGSHRPLLRPLRRARERVTHRKRLDVHDRKRAVASPRSLSITALIYGRIVSPFQSSGKG